MTNAQLTTNDESKVSMSHLRDLSDQTILYKTSITILYAFKSNTHHQVRRMQ